MDVEDRFRNLEQQIRLYGNLVILGGSIAVAAIGFGAAKPLPDFAQRQNSWHHTEITG